MKKLSMDMADWNLVPLVRVLAITDLFRLAAICRGDRLEKPFSRLIASDVSETCLTQRLPVCFRATGLAFFDSAFRMSTSPIPPVKYSAIFDRAIKS